MIDLHCKIVNCEKVAEREALCSRHARLVLDQGEDPVNLARCTTWKDQCPMHGFFDGGNACTLVVGHAGEHEGYFGSRCDRWGTGDEVQAYLASFYRHPRTWES